MKHVNNFPTAPRREDRRDRGEAGAVHAEVGADVLAARDGGAAQGENGGPQSGIDIGIGPLSE